MGKSALALLLALAFATPVVEARANEMSKMENSNGQVGRDIARYRRRRKKRRGRGRHHRRHSRRYWR